MPRQFNILHTNATITTTTTTATATDIDDNDIDDDKKNGFCNKYACVYNEIVIRCRIYIVDMQHTTSASH